MKFLVTIHATFHVIIHVTYLASVWPAKRVREISREFQWKKARRDLNTSAAGFYSTPKTRAAYLLDPLKFLTSPRSLSPLLSYLSTSPRPTLLSHGVHSSPLATFPLYPCLHSHHLSSPDFPLLPLPIKDVCCAPAVLLH